MFKGFTPETIDFLWGIRFNNRRDWFNEHKQMYLETLYRPMQELAAAVSEKYQLEGTILKTARIYRDVRFSGGIPYKEHLWFCIRKPDVFWSEHPSMYFQIEPEGGSCGFIHYAPAASLMALHRKHLLEQPDVFSGILNEILKEPEFQDCSLRYKRPKPGSTPETANLYDMKNCFIERQIPVGEQLFSEQLPELLAETFRKLEPLYHYFERLENEMEAVRE